MATFLSIIRHHRPFFSASSPALTTTTSPSHENKHDIKRLGVLGAGQMGLGIALVAANIAKLPVVIVDAKQDQLQKGIKLVEQLLNKDVSKERITSQHATETLARITTSESIDNFSEVDFVIEAVSENLPLKLELFKQLDNLAPPHAILATNTSSISITKVAAATISERATKVIGMHFMNPVPVMKLVEIIPGLATDNHTLTKTRALAAAMGKTCTTSQDVPGFVANRLLMPYINEAIITLETGVATKEDIDTTMKLGTNMPMGPLTLADFIGLDTCLAIMKVMHEGTGDSKYRPSVLLQKYVDAGWVGKKGGRGFYEY